MVAVEFNEATKKISLSQESLDGLLDEEQQNAQSTVDLVNRLMADLVAHNGEAPPPPNTRSQNISVAASKVATNGVAALKQGKPEEAVKLLSTALELVLRRPLWEPTMVLLEEVTLCLMPRCDAYVALKKWAEAYADASLLMIMRPNDPMNSYRKGMILLSAGRRSEARELLQAAARMAPGNAVIETGLKSIDESE